jgi:ribosome-associated protein
MPREWNMPANPETESLIPDVPESECWITYARSSGPGGQNVNKRATKAVVKWHVEGSETYDDDQKRLIAAALANRISNEGYVVISAEAERSREQNRKNAVETLRRLVREALTPEEERIPTKPSRAAKRRRLDEKSKRGAIKRERQKRYGEEE